MCDEQVGEERQRAEEDSLLYLMEKGDEVAGRLPESRAPSILATRYLSEALLSLDPLASYRPLVLLLFEKMQVDLLMPTIAALLLRRR